MAWEARSGLKLKRSMGMIASISRLNGLGSPFGFETPLFFITFVL